MNKKLYKIINKWTNKINHKNINCFFYLLKLVVIFFLLILVILILLFNRINVLKDNLDDNLIKVGYYCRSIKYGGVERVMSIIINYLSKENIFSQYLITKSDILEGEYPISNTTKRIRLVGKRTSLFEAIKKYNIDILIYNFYEKREIRKLNKLSKVKVIYYDHSSFLYWIYLKVYKFEDSIYYEYKKCHYVISLIPVENDYLFKKWGINSILMHNPTSFEYDSVIPSDLSFKNIIMIGRNDDPIKRFDLGIKAMKNIIKEISNCQMNIVSLPIEDYEELILDLNLEKNVRFVGFHKNVEVYLRNSSLHILPSLSESYSLALSEAKIFGIPSIICGLDYLALAKKGTVIIYDDDPDTIAKESIKILKNDKYRKRLGNEARKSMEKFKNRLIAKKWVKLLLAVYKGDEKLFKELLSENENKINDSEANEILNNQLKLLQKRNTFLNQTTLNQLELFSFY